MVHLFQQDICHIVVPECFPSPFNGQPHPLCRVAASEVMDYLMTQTRWHNELDRGKMLGVLIVSDHQSRIGFLAAFSGNLDGKNNHSYFVPPIADLLYPDGFFKRGEALISHLNRKLKELENDGAYLHLKSLIETTEKEADLEIAAFKNMMRQARDQRASLRLLHPSADELLKMERESQHQKASLKRLERKWSEQVAHLYRQLNPMKQAMDLLREERKQRSASLQKQLFNEYRLLNGLGETQMLDHIFSSTVLRVPPAGAGDCAGPKLLQYAYANNLKPLAMAEFWWGRFANGEMRRHGEFYPACKGKCEPIMEHMLKGLAMDDVSLCEFYSADIQIDVVFEDEWMVVVDKPAGLLSAPGKSGGPSVVELLNESGLADDALFLVHRLDMATSGLLVLAKNQDVYKNLQHQFETRQVKKRYLAVVEGVPLMGAGVIHLPLSADWLNRPRQMIDFINGKQAETHYKVLKVADSQALVELYPVTGRTHQLRVHCAHPQGLACPIQGDALYGSPSDRLLLHAEYLKFQHPVTQSLICLESEAPFRNSWALQHR